MTLLSAFRARRKPALKLPELAALLLLVATTVFYMSVLRPAEDRLQALEDAIAKRKQASPLIAVSYAGAPTDPAAKLGAFYAFFDKGNTFTDWLARLHAVAERTGVELKQGEYRRIEPADVPLVLQEMTLPVSGDYLRIRALAEGVLGAIPVASLDHVTFRRQRANSNVIEAELKFTFYLPRPKP